MRKEGRERSEQAKPKKGKNRASPERLLSDKCLKSA
jgi:hypothetical protein